MKTRVVHRTGGEIVLVQLYIQLQLLSVNSPFAAINFLVLIPNAIHVPFCIVTFSHPGSAVESIKSVLSICVSGSGLPTEPFDTRIQYLLELLTMTIPRMG